VVREVGIARLPAVPGGILPSSDSEAVLSALGFLHVARPDLRNLEGAQTDERTELDDDIVSLAVCSPSQVLNLAVCEPDLVFITAGGFDTHYD
jgi:hypothetical protein